MIKQLFLSLLFVFYGFSLWAVNSENILMIELEGSTKGLVQIELFPEIAPLHVERIKTLARDGRYNNIVFHRVIDGFMAQTGDVKFGKRKGYKQRYGGQGGSNYPNLPAEFSNYPFEKGVVGMARGHDLNSANSQFFIMFSSAPHLNGQYTVIGKVIEGQDFIDSIKRGQTSANGSVSNPDYMKRVWIKFNHK